MSTDVSITIALCNITAVGCSETCHASAALTGAVQEVDASRSPSICTCSVCYGLTGSRLFGTPPPFFSISVTYQKSTKGGILKKKKESSCLQFFFCVGVARLIGSLFSLFPSLLHFFSYMYDFIYRSEGEAVLKCECCVFLLRGETCRLRSSWSHREE